MANLVVCCDGTWASADNKTNGVPTPTNVVKIHAAVAEKDGAGKLQHKYYHPGVGTEGGIFNKVVGGGIGLGLDRNIKSAYRWLADAYKPGDNIFLIGFSRGAYTVRSLGGMISSCGLVDFAAMSVVGDKQWPVVDEIFDNYRDSKAKASDLTHLHFHNAQKGKVGKGKTDIQFLGVWDTVGALGIPDELELLNLFDDPEKHMFHDTSLSKIVKVARHAVAIDEPRGTFTPTLWTKVSPGTDCEEIWFPGVHSDVGGGYIERGLSDGALEWMMAEAKKAGLEFRSGVLAQLNPDPLDVLHDPISGIYEDLKARPRSVPCLTGRAANRNFHKSALDRHKNPPLIQPIYWPSRHLRKGQQTVLDIFAREKWNTTGLFLEAGETYQLSADGEWLDASISCGPAGTSDGNFQPGEILHVLASGLGRIEDWFKRATDNDDADFRFTRREGKMPWFSLVGVVANGRAGDNNGKRLPHQTFLIGTGRKLRPAADGYLYAYANDAWQMYDNNRGSVQLTVKRTS
jgi:hypothetical protein